MREAMKNDNDGRWGRTTLACAVAVGLAFVSGLARADFDYGGRLSASAGYVNNLNLAPPGTVIDDAPLYSLQPSLELREVTRSVRAALDYNLQSYFYGGYSDLNQTRHAVAANGEWIAVPDWFRTDVVGNYSQQVVNPARQINISSMFVTSNQVNSMTAFVTPTLFHRWGDVLFDTHYSYGRVRYFDKGSVLFDPNLNPNALDNSSNKLLTSHLGTAAESRVTWALDYNMDTVDYDVSLPYKYERAAAEVGYLIGAGVRAVAGGGVESDLSKSTFRGGLDSDFWDTGLRWNPSPATSVEALVGHRFFGNTYTFKWTREARYLHLGAAYTEQPQTLSQELIRKDLVPGQIAPPPIGLNLGPITPETYLAKRAELNLALNGQYNVLGIEGYSERREYLPSAAREQYKGLAATFTRHFSARTDLTIGSASAISDVRFAAEVRDLRGTLTIGHQIGASLTVALDAGYLARNSAEPDLEYRAWFATLRLTQSFGHVAPPK
jgi:hypothetical protein